MERQDVQQNVQEEEKQVTAYDVEMKKLEMEERKELEHKEFKERNKHKIRGLLLAFLTIASLFDYGFFKTLGIWILMLVGYGVGAWYDRDADFIRFLNNFLRRFR